MSLSCPFSVSNVAPVEMSGPQHGWQFCSTTDFGVNEGLSSCAPFGNPVAVVQMYLSYQAFLRMWFDKPCAGCSAKSGRISMAKMMGMMGPFQTPEGCGPNHMNLLCVRPAVWAFALRIMNVKISCVTDSVCCERNFLFVFCFFANKLRKKCQYQAYKTMCIQRW